LTQALSNLPAKPCIYCRTGPY